MSSFWLISYALQLDSTELASAVFWRKVKYLGVVAAPVVWFVFCVQYAGFSRTLTQGRLLALGLVPAMTFALVLTNEQHHLIWTTTPLTPADVRMSAFGPAFGAFLLFTYVMLLLGSFALLRSVARSTQPYQRQVLVLIGSLALPWGASIITLIGPAALAGLDPTPVAYTLTDLVLGWGIVRQHLLTGRLGVMSYARNRIVEAMFESTTGIAVLDASNRVVEANVAAARIVSIEGRPLVGAALETLLGSPASSQALLTSGGHAVELHLQRGAQVRHCIAHLLPVTDDAGALTGWVLTLNDITDRKRAEAALEESERRYRTVVNSLSEVVFQTDATGRWTLLNPAWTELTGYTIPESLGTWAATYIFHEDRPIDERESVSLLSGAKALARYELRFQRVEGAIRWFHVQARPITRADGAIVGIAGTLIDMTERKRLEQKLVHQAFHDALTGLANRTRFRERVEHTLTRASRSAGEHAVLFLDLDDFKKVNDNLGHSAGDELLCVIAQRLVASVRSSDTVARLGGDEFAVLLEDLAHADDAIETAGRILDALNHPVMIDGKDVLVGASIGIAALQRSGDSAETVLSNADLAMYTAKRTGRGRFVVFSDGMDADSRHRLELEADLYRAIERDELRVLYQPTVNVNSGQITGVEALVRWQHPEHGVIMPAEFIPIAEETGSIVAIGRWVLQRACRDVRAWQVRDSAQARLSVAVNLSARQLLDPLLVADVAQALADCGLDPVLLTLEITETVAMQDTEATIARLGALKALGVRLAIDDFGTGYSSLSYLQRFPIDILKIDRAFVQGIAENQDDQALARTIVHLASTLRLSTVAEGIETGGQVEQLRKLGCSHGQGYYYARPLPSEQITAILDAEQRLEPLEVA